VRTSPLRLGYGIAMMASQMVYNDLSRRAHEPSAHFYHSRTRTSQQLEQEMNEHLKTRATLDTLHRDLDSERRQDEVIQVQNELSAVRRALALNSSQK
jgi:ubiquitin C-terminal hydrolase